jgi:hypothetical protein
VRFTSFLRAVVEGTNLSPELLEVRVKVEADARPEPPPVFAEQLTHGETVLTRATSPKTDLARGALFVG